VAFRGKTYLLIIQTAALTLANAASLLDRSPFLPPAYEAEVGLAPSAATADSDEDYLEFRGVYRLNGVVYANIRDKRDRQSRWIRMNRPRDGFTLLGFDPRSNVCTVEAKNGIRHVLPLIHLSETTAPSFSTGSAMVSPEAPSGPGPKKPRALRVSTGRNPKEHSIRVQARHRALAGNPVRLERLRKEARLSQTSAHRAFAGRNKESFAGPVVLEPSHPDEKIRAIRLATVRHAAVETDP